MLHGIAWYCMVLHGIAWQCMVLHYLASSCTILHYLALSCTILHIRYTCSQQMSPVIAFVKHYSLYIAVVAQKVKVQCWGPVCIWKSGVVVVLVISSRSGWLLELLTELTKKWHLCGNISIFANHTLPCQLLVDGSQACLHLSGFNFKLWSK